MNEEQNTNQMVGFIKKIWTCLDCVLSPIFFNSFFFLNHHFTVLYTHSIQYKHTEFRMIFIKMHQNLFSPLLFVQKKLGVGGEKRKKDTFSHSFSITKIFMQ